MDQATLDKEKEILLVQAKEDPKNANKPENIIEKMVMGRIGKSTTKRTACSSRPSSRRTRSPWRSISPRSPSSLGGKIAVKTYTRFETGEGIEKKEDDFAAEVASMIK